MEFQNTQKKRCWDKLSIDQHIEHYRDEEKLFIKNICSDNFEFIASNIHLINDKKLQNDSFFIACCFSSSVKIIELMYNHYNININNVAMQHHKCFLLVCYVNDCVDVIRYLVENTKVDIMQCDESLNNCLHIASEMNCPEVLEYFIKEKGMDPWSLNNQGFDCLMRTCFLNNNVEAVKYYIEVIGMNPLQTNKYQQNCLTLACQLNDLTVIKYLIEQKMDPLYKDIHGYDCLFWACYCNHLDVIKYLVNVIGIEKINEKKNQSNKKYNYLISACKINTDVRIIKYLIEEVGIDINHQNEDGDNCLLIAATTNPEPMIIKYLTEEINMDPNITNAKGWNCLKNACCNNNLKIIKYLITEMGMNINYNDMIETERTNNCLLDASMNPNLEVIKYFIEEMRMDIEYSNDIGNNCLLIACALNKNVEIIKYMIEELKMDTNKLNIDGTNCLTLCLHLNKSLNVAKYLIECTNIPIKLGNLRRNEYISCLQRLQSNQQRINEFITKGIESYGTKCVFKKDDNITRFFVNPLIFNYEIRKLLNVYFFECEYESFVFFADVLGCKILLEEDVMNRNTSDSETNDTETSDSETSVIETNHCTKELLFLHNNTPYYGSRDIVYRSILLLRDTEYLNHDNPMNLSVNAPEYVIRLYIDSCYSGKINIDQFILPEDFVDFLKLIDQYPTTVLAIDKLEIQLIKYIDKNKIIFDEEIDMIISKYHLKHMYLYQKGKLIIEKNNN